MPGGYFRRRHPLGIPTIRDWVVQTAVLLIIEPIFKVDCMDCSHGFRPRRSDHGARVEVRKYLSQGLQAVHDADLKKNFNSIPHDKLMKFLRMRIVDRSVLKLIRLWIAIRIAMNNRGVSTGNWQPL